MAISALQGWVSVRVSYLRERCYLGVVHNCQISSINKTVVTVYPPLSVMSDIDIDHFCSWNQVKCIDFFYFHLMIIKIKTQTQRNKKYSLYNY